MFNWLSDYPLMNQTPAHAHTRFRQVRELLQDILPFTVPADQVIERYFKSHKQMGSKDRAFAAESVYGILRHWRELTTLQQAFSHPDVDDVATRVAIYLASKSGWSARALEAAGFTPYADDLIVFVRQHDKSSWTSAQRLNLSDDSFERLHAQFDDAALAQLTLALNQAAPVDMRVNTLRTSREQAQTALQQEGFVAELTPFSPLGLRRAQRGPLFNTAVFKQGLIEIQDEGSQLIGLLVQAKPRQRIVDFCAGAGGKTLLLAAQMRNRGEIIACDVSPKRLHNMKPRLQRAGVDNVRLLAINDEHDAQFDALIAQCHAVLVDAPCSGSGTWRRNPDMKWRAIDVMDLQRQQRDILQSASRLCQPGGRLVYATCSLFAEENQHVVNAFLAANPHFVLRDASAILAAEGVADAAQFIDAQGMMQLLPHRHHTDGFFAAALERIKE